MNLNKAAAKYRRTHVESSPARILEALLRRLLRDCEEAKRALAAGDMAKKGELISHALAIIGELTAALDHEAAPDLCEQLSSLYGFASERLVSGSVRLDPRLIEEAASVVATIQGAFATAMEKAL